MVPGCAHHYSKSNHDNFEDNYSFTHTSTSSNNNCSALAAVTASSDVNIHSSSLYTVKYHHYFHPRANQDLFPS